MKQFCFSLLMLFFIVGSSSYAEEIPLRKSGGVFHVPVQINGVITLDFIIDTGAAEVTIPADVVMTLMRAGTIAKDDLLSDKDYTLADGTRVNSQRLVLKSLKIGNQTLENITASITEVEGPLLLGQTFLERLGAFSFNAQNQTLKFNERHVIAKAPAEKAAEETSSESSSVVDRRIDASTPEGAVEIFLRSVADQRFEISWSSLSKYSQTQIIEKITQEENGSYSAQEIRDLFEKNDATIRRGFWRSYRESSKIPELVTLATYKPTENRDGEATVKVKIGSGEVEFKTYQENRTWKVGLVESIEVEN